MSLPPLDGRTAVQILENIIDAIWDAHREAINEVRSDLTTAPIPPLRPPPSEEGCPGTAAFSRICRSTYPARKRVRQACGPSIPGSKRPAPALREALRGGTVRTPGDV